MVPLCLLSFSVAVCSWGVMGCRRRCRNLSPKKVEFQSLGALKLSALNPVPQNPFAPKPRSILEPKTNPLHVRSSQDKELQKGSRRATTTISVRDLTQGPQQLEEVLVHTIIVQTIASRGLVVSDKGLT